MEINSIGMTQRRKMDYKNYKRIFRTALYLFIVSTFILFQNQTTLMALSPEQRKLLDSGIGYYDIDPLELCGPTGSTANLAGAEALKNQQGLDERWIDIISRAASEKGVDPIYMAGLLWVENRGWPEYKTSGWAISSSSGSGPWQIIASSWSSSAGPYSEASNPEVSTFVAAELIKGMGGDVSNLPMGSIRDDFSRGNNLKTVASVAKNYNAGSGTYRTPGVAGYKQAGRVWARSGNPWGSTKQIIIDNYILIFQHVYYHIATGQQVPALGDNNVHADAAIAMISTIESYGGGGGTTSELGTNSIPDGKAVIALDPGHGGAVAQYTDAVTGLGDRETTNSPEREDVLDVANRVKAQLEQAGNYEIVMLRTGPDEAVSKRARVDRAKQAGAVLAVSIHTDTTPIEEVWPQFAGGYRQTGNTKVEFLNQETAKKSDQYSDIIAEERNKAQFGGASSVKKVTGQANSFGASRGLPATGDISLVQLWSDTVPWIYNESTAPAGGMNNEQKEAYATGLANGIKKSVEASGSSGASCGGNVNTGNVAGTALSYAWPDYRGNGFVTLKPEYDQAVQAAVAERRYVGGTRHRAVDCGGFVTTVMIDSGFDTAYNHSGLLAQGAGYTAIQLEWVRDNWQSLGRGDTLSTDQLQPGDVAFRVRSNGANDGHTFMWVGTQPNFETQVASASWDERSPMAGKESPLRSNIEWFRKN